MMEGSKAAEKGPIPAPVDDGYCVAEKALFVTEQRKPLCGGPKIAVRDSEGRVVFTSKKNKIFSGDSKEPLLYFKKKWRKWEVYRGKKELLFRMGKTSIFQWRKSFDIFVAGNDSRKVDFRMTANFFTTKFVIHHVSTPVTEVENKQSCKPVAEVEKKQSCKLFCKSRTHYTIEAYAGVDSAFLTCLVLIMEKDSECLVMELLPDFIVEVLTNVPCG